MTYQILFAALCAVIAGHILVAVIAIIRAFREERMKSSVAYSSRIANAELGGLTIPLR